MNESRQWIAHDNQWNEDNRIEHEEQKEDETTKCH